MRAIRFTMLLMVLGLLGTATDSLAQAPDELATGMWESVQALPAGEIVIVKLKDRRIVKGKLVSATDQELKLSGKKKVFARRQVRKVYHVVGKSNRKAVLIGTGVGFGAGAGTGLLIASVNDETAFARKDIMAAVFSLGGATVGAGIASLLTKGKKNVLIYDAGVLKTLSVPPQSIENQ